MVAFAPLHNHHMERLRRLATTDCRTGRLSSPAFRSVVGNSRRAGAWKKRAAHLGRDTKAS